VDTLWFHSFSDLLFLFRVSFSQKSAQALGMIDLLKCNVYPSNEANQFIVSNKETGRDYLLNAENESEKEQWITVIEPLIPQDKKKVSSSSSSSSSSSTSFFFFLPSLFTSFSLITTNSNPFQIIL
jgi:hypothetical protein